MLQYDKGARSYTTHPLIRAHYLAHLQEGNQPGMVSIHTRIKDYYLAITGNTSSFSHAREFGTPI